MKKKWKQGSNTVFASSTAGVNTAAVRSRINKNKSDDWGYGSQE
jgi:hypothetical protein